DVRVRLHRGTATVVGRRSDDALYKMALATYGRGDTFDHKAAEGFIQVYGLPLRNQARTQALWSGTEGLPLKLPETTQRSGGSRSSPRRAKPRRGLPKRA
ncbi:MAG: argininosuccinate synthase, partial [Chloroflexi bacterium]|nr:argininosuccinate synthase [Chloroflexota bacterium]